MIFNWPISSGIISIANWLAGAEKCPLINLFLSAQSLNSKVRSQKVTNLMLFVTDQNRFVASVTNIDLTIIVPTRLLKHGYFCHQYTFQD